MNPTSFRGRALRLDLEPQLRRRQGYKAAPPVSPAMARRRDCRHFVDIREWK